MIPIFELQQRSLSGPVMKSDEFDLALVKTVRRLVAKHGIKYNPEELVVDDQTADAVFLAGKEMLAETGLYNLDTQRVIKFTLEELDQIAAEYQASAPSRTASSPHGLAARISGDCSVSGPSRVVRSGRTATSSGCPAIP